MIDSAHIGKLFFLDGNTHVTAISALSAVTLVFAHALVGV
jgi:hypothetical protein